MEAPPKLIQEFQSLLQQRKSQDRHVSRAMEKIIFADHLKFYLFLNHCFYLILDCWLETPESMFYTKELANCLETISNSQPYDRQRKRVVQLVNDYKQTRYYLQLKTVIAIVNPFKIDHDDEGNTLITNEDDASEFPPKSELINDHLVRYPFLYSYFAPSESEFSRLQDLIARLQNSRQQDYEILLAKHITYRIRLKQFAKMRLLSHGAGKAISKVENPSLLSEKAFRIALKQYTGKIDHQQTLLEQAQHFLTENKFRSSYQEFKRDLYYFITKEIKPRNNNYSFKNLLKQKLGEIFAQSEDKPLNRTLILQTCRQLLSFLVLDPKISSDPEKFAEIIANLGTAQVMKILLKVILICPESKPDLEKKLWLTISYYQLQNSQEMPWLIKSLEHLLMAFSIYFGHFDASLAKSALSQE